MSVPFVRVSLTPARPNLNLVYKRSFSPCWPIRISVAGDLAWCEQENCLRFFVPSRMAEYRMSLPSEVQRFFWVRGERVFVLAGYDESIFVRVSDTGLEERVFPFGYKMVYEHNVFPVSGFPPTSYITAPFKLVVILLANEERLYYRPGAEVKLGYQINKDAELGEWASEVVIWDETGEKRGISFADTTEGTVGVSQSGRVVVVRSTIIRAGESTIYTLGENFVSIWQPVFPDIGFVAGGRGKLALVSLAEERPVGWEMEWQVKCAGLCADGCLIAVDDCGIWLSQAPIKSIGEQEAAKQKEKDGL